MTAEKTTEPKLSFGDHLFNFLKNLFTTIIFFACLGALVYFAAQRLQLQDKDKKGAEKSAPAMVSTTLVVKKVTPVELKGFGSLVSNATVSVRSQVTGMITNVHFKEGQEIKRGDLLFTIDDRPFKVELNRSEASLGRDKVQLANAEKEAARQEELFQKGFSSLEVRDQARTAADALAAAVKADNSAVETAKLNIEYCSIHSAIDGRAGAHLVDVGNLVRANDSVLAIINQIRPIQVDFSLPQQHVQEIRKRMAAGKVVVRAQMPSRDDKPAEPPELGQLEFVDNTVDTTTGTIRLKATFPNENERLWPGQFVSVTLALYEEEALVVPNNAVQVSQKGRMVFVVKDDMTVESRPVVVERNYGDDAIISEGLNIGEQIVTEGHLRLTPGCSIVIKNNGNNGNGGEKSDGAKNGKSKASGTIGDKRISEEKKDIVPTVKTDRTPGDTKSDVSGKKTEKQVGSSTK